MQRTEAPKGRPERHLLRTPHDVQVVPFLGINTLIKVLTDVTPQKRLLRLLPPLAALRKYFCAWLATWVGVRVGTNVREMPRQLPLPVQSMVVPTRRICYTLWAHTATSPRKFSISSAVLSLLRAGSIPRTPYKLQRIRAKATTVAWCALCMVYDGHTTLEEERGHTRMHRKAQSRLAGLPPQPTHM
eukprot:scaffold20526_cov18-Tisochrysis_lutea.AAC.1